MMSQDQINELTRAVGRIEGKLDSLLEVPERISSLERWRAWTLGAGTVIGLAAGALWGLITTVVHGR